MPQSPQPLRIGTRGSRLALVQAEMVRKGLQQAGFAGEIIVIKTSGDQILDRPLADAGGKGLFVKELEAALLDGRIDLAVHSMKDVPVERPEGLVIGAILEREDPRDAFVSPKYASLADLPQGAKLGSSSVRRTAQLKRLRPDLEIVLLRGNVDTRLKKLEAGEMDGALLAVAGLNRLGLESHIREIMEKLLPALSQGAIGIEVRDNDARAKDAIKSLHHEPTAIALAVERNFQQALDGSCRSPIAGLATIYGNELDFFGEVLSPDGSESHSISFTLHGFNAESAARTGLEAGENLYDRARKLLK